MNREINLEIVPGTKRREGTAGGWRGLQILALLDSESINW